METKTETKKLSCSFCENDLIINETTEENLFICVCSECERQSLISKKTLIKLGLLI